jgi:hypothetical protein
MSKTITPIHDEIGVVSVRWLRINAAADAYGICRSKLYSLIRSGAIRSVCLREENSTRGTRLVNAASLDQYINKHEGVWSEPPPDKIPF